MRYVFDKFYAKLDKKAYHWEIYHQGYCKVQ